MINLQKGQTIDLKKSTDGQEFDLSKVTIGLGWDINGSAGSDYDLDAVAILLDSNGKIGSSNDIIYYGNKMHLSKNIWSNGDNLTGAGDGDDEQIEAKLENLDQKYDKIVFFTSIYQGQSRGQNFGNIQNAFIRAIDAKGKEIARYNISSDQSLKEMRSFIFAEMYRKNGTWKFRALGDAKNTDSLMQVCESYK